MSIEKLSVIGISGKAGSGKDFLACEIFKPRGFMQIALAWPIKAIAYARRPTGTTFEDIYDRKPPEIRKLLQHLGTEEGRDVYGESYWIDQTYALMRMIQRSTGNNQYVITDVRFPNEVEFIHNLGGLVIRVVGRQSSLADGEQHRSEIELDDFKGFDSIIQNQEGTTVQDIEIQLQRITK